MPSKFVTVCVPLRHLHTILAALRYYQERGQGEAANRSDIIQEIASNDGAVRALDAAEIDRLCERINTTA